MLHGVCVAAGEGRLMIQKIVFVSALLLHSL